MWISPVRTTSCWLFWRYMNTQSNHQIISLNWKSNHDTPTLPAAAPRHINSLRTVWYSHWNFSTEKKTASENWWCVLNTQTKFAVWIFVSSEIHASDLREDDVTWSSIHLTVYLHTCQVETGQRTDTAIYHNAAACDTDRVFNFKVEIFSWSETFHMFSQFCVVTLRLISQVTGLQYMTEMQCIMTSRLYSRARCEPVQCSWTSQTESKCWIYKWVLE